MPFVYANQITKKIVLITEAATDPDIWVEVEVLPTDPVILDSNPYENFRLNDTDDGIVPELRKPKIFDLAKKEARDKHIHNLDYKTELTQSLYPKRNMVQGEVQLVEWFSDQALTDKILKVDIAYVRDALGFALERTTTRTWINKDESENSDTKVTHKRYDINLYEQLIEGQRRRQNLANEVSMNVLAQMHVVLNGVYTPDVITQKGRDFLLLHTVAWTEFVKSSHQQILTDVALPDLVHDEWLDQDMVPGTTIRQYIINEMTLY